VVDCRTRRERNFEFVWFVRNYSNPLDALGAHLMRNHVDREIAVMRLTAGHGHRVIVQYLVSDIGAGSARKTDRKRAGMIIGPVAYILKNVLAGRKRRLADPLRTLAAHLREAMGVAVHPERHKMAADSSCGN
jgi:hypothetical protein